LTIRAGQPGQDSFDRTARKGKHEQDSLKMGHAKRAANIGLPGQDSSEGLLRQDFQDMTSGTGSQSRYCNDIL
jgi:hypothetical protein